MKTFSLILLFVISTIFNAKAHVALVNPIGGETFTSGQTITISWQEVIAHNTLNWDLYFSSDGGLTWDILQLDIPLASLTYQWNLPDIVTSEARIRIVQDNVDSDYSADSENFTITIPTGIGTKNEGNELKVLDVFPNPLHEFACLIFENPENRSFTLNLYNTQGGFVMTMNTETSKLLIDRGDLPEGIYFFRLFSESEIEGVGRFIIK